jgi:hypothetical protein
MTVGRNRLLACCSRLLNAKRMRRPESDVTDETWPPEPLKHLWKRLSNPYRTDRPTRLHNGTAVTLSNLNILSCHAEHVCSFLRDRPRDSQSSHLGEQRSSLQSQFRSCTALCRDDDERWASRFREHDDCRHSQTESSNAGLIIGAQTYGNPRINVGRELA